MPFLSFEPLIPFAVGITSPSNCRSALQHVRQLSFCTLAAISLTHCTPSQPLDSYRDGVATGTAGRSIQPIPDAGSRMGNEQGPVTVVPAFVDAGAPDASTAPVLPLFEVGDANAPDATATFAATTCAGELEFASGESCYLAIVATTTWQAGRALCQQWEGDLVTIQSQEEEALLVANGPDFDFWIGYNDRETEGEYTWASNLEGLSGPDAPWAGDQPTATSDENCVARLRPNIGPTLEPGWYDRGCTEEYGSFCERPLQ